MARMEQNIIFFGGKGGVGKSTCSSAWAYGLARQGYKTLLVSTDPAHNLHDLFGKAIDADPTPLGDHLYGLEIDASKEAKRYIEGVKANLNGLVKTHMVEEVHRQIDMAQAAPGTDESALFDKIVSIVLDEYEHFDKIVFDTAPTGHTLRLLTLPELMNTWIEGMIKRRRKVHHDYSQWLGDSDRPDDPIYEILNQRRKRFAEVRDLLLNTGVTGFVFVVNPEKLPIVEAEQAVHQLGHYGLKVGTIIVNKCLPDQGEDDFWRRRQELEQGYRSWVRTSFDEQEVVEIPLLSSDITDFDELDQVADELGKGDGGL